MSVEFPDMKLTDELKESRFGEVMQEVCNYQ